MSDLKDQVKQLEEELDKIDTMSVDEIKAYLLTPNRCWSDSYCDCQQQHLADRMVEHYERLKARLAEAERLLRICRAARARLAEAERLLHEARAWVRSDDLEHRIDVFLSDGDSE